MAKKSRGDRNNNPGNIEYGAFAKRHGSTGREKKGRFAVFKTPEDGIRALAALQRSYESKDGLTTIAARINKWSPAGENGRANTNAYINDVARQMGIGPTQEFSINDPVLGPALVSAIIAHENGYQPYSPEQITSAHSLEILDQAAPPTQVAAVPPTPTQNPAGIDALGYTETPDQPAPFDAVMGGDPVVRETQASLNRLGYGIAEDGIVGPDTEGAIAHFQMSQGVASPSGVADADTMQRLAARSDPQHLMDIGYRTDGIPMPRARPEENLPPGMINTPLGVAPARPEQAQPLQPLDQSAGGLLSERDFNETIKGLTTLSQQPKPSDRSRIDNPIQPSPAVVPTTVPPNNPPKVAGAARPLDLSGARYSNHSELRSPSSRSFVPSVDKQRETMAQNMPGMSVAAREQGIQMPSAQRDLMVPDSDILSSMFGSSVGQSNSLASASATPPPTYTPPQVGVVNPVAGAPAFEVDADKPADAQLMFGKDGKITPGEVLTGVGLFTLNPALGLAYGAKKLFKANGGVEGLGLKNPFKGFGSGLGSLGFDQAQYNRMDKLGPQSAPLGRGGATASRSQNGTVFGTTPSGMGFTSRSNDKNNPSSNDRTFKVGGNTYTSTGRRGTANAMRLR